MYSTINNINMLNEIVLFHPKMQLRWYVTRENATFHNVFPDKICEYLRYIVLIKRTLLVGLKEFIFGGPNSFIAR